MQVKINKKDLLNMIGVAGKAVSPKAEPPILTGLKISAAEDGQIKICGTNLNMSVAYTSSAEVEKSGDIAVNAKLFGEAVKRLPNEDITITSDEKNIIKLECVKSKIQLSGLSVKDYPDMEKVEAEYSFSIPQCTLKNLMQKTVSFAATTEGKKPILTGVLLDIKNEKVTAVASDGHRLARVIGEEPVECEDVQFVIPAVVIRELLKITADTDSCIDITSDKKKIVFNFGEYVVSARLLDGTYLDYKRIMNDMGEVKAKVKKADLMNLLDRAMLIINSEGAADIKLPVKLEIKDGRVKADCVATIGSIHDEVVAETTGEILIAFNCGFLIDALKVCEKSEVELSMSAPTNGAFLHDTENALYLILPVRMHN